MNVGEMFVVDRIPLQSVMFGGHTIQDLIRLPFEDGDRVMILGKCMQVTGSTTTLRYTLQSIRGQEMLDCDLYTLQALCVMGVLREVADHTPGDVCPHCGQTGDHQGMVYYPMDGVCRIW